jgi:hypothetical protein
MGWFGVSGDARYIDDQVKLYGLTIFSTLRNFLGNEFYKNLTNWVDSSPSGGFVSYDPYVTK